MVNVPHNCGTCMSSYLHLEYHLHNYLIILQSSIKYLVININKNVVSDINHLYAPSI